jgi:pyruvate/2-oxoglutarate dehydrogenase complex dihydrolipoamide acyltransferase (E2) component
MDSSVLEINIAEGNKVSIGDTLFVVSAMKMETIISAPCSGIVAALQPLKVGDRVAAGQVMAVISPSGETGQSISSATSSQNTSQSWKSVLDEVSVLQDLARERLEVGSEDPGVVRQRSRGKLTCRERITLLLDEGTFREVGSVAGFASYDEEGAIAGFTPANMVGGWGGDQRADYDCLC